MGKRNANDLPSSWAWERFTVVQVSAPSQVTAPSLKAGSTIALHNSRLNRFARMDGTEDTGATHPRMDASSKRDANDLPSNWAWERFTVVDAGNGQIALHNSRLNRFVRMDGTEDTATHPRMDASSKRDANDLPSS